MQTVTTVAGLRERVAHWRAKGERIALIPTMGALHDGHMSLVSAGQNHADRSVVSLFINPRQFAPDEDLSTYPRDLQSDSARLEAAQVDLLYAPDTDQVYPDGFATTVQIEGPAEGLEAASRPGFFAGVATVVTKLFTQALPDIAVFGEKDYQQLLVVKRFVRDLDLKPEILAFRRSGRPTVSRSRRATPISMTNNAASRRASMRSCPMSLHVCPPMTIRPGCWPTPITSWANLSTKWTILPGAMPKLLPMMFDPAGPGACWQRLFSVRLALSITCRCRR